MSRKPKEIEERRGQSRVLVIFAPERTHPSYMEAREELAAAAEELARWEVEVFTAFSSGHVYTQAGRLPTDSAEYRRDFGAHPSEFNAVLLDMDGQELVRHHGRLGLGGMIDALKLTQQPEPAPRIREPAPRARR